MVIGRIKGQLYSTINHPFYDKRRLLIVDKIDPETGHSKGYLTAIDTVRANIGETVIVIDEGNSARQILKSDNGPVRSVIVGIVDDPVL